MSRHLFIDLAGWASILSWLAASIFLAATGDAEFFQRTGSFGVAVGVAYFVSVRLVSGVLVAPGQAEYQAGVHRQFALNHVGTMTALRNTTLIATYLTEKDKMLGHPTSDLLAELASQKAVEKTSRFDGYKWEEAQNEIADSLLKGQLKADDLVREAWKAQEVMQAVVVVVATLQWGFGDLLIEAM